MPARRNHNDGNKSDAFINNNNNDGALVTASDPFDDPKVPALRKDHAVDIQGGNNDKEFFDIATDTSTPTVAWKRRKSGPSPMASPMQPVPLMEMPAPLQQTPTFTWERKKPGPRPWPRLLIRNPMVKTMTFV